MQYRQTDLSDAGRALLKSFTHIYVINLPERTDRRREVEEQLNRFGLSLEHPAVSLVPASRPADRGEFPNIGARGCFESHLITLRAAQDAGHENFLILEDDADFSDDFESRAEAVSEAAQRVEWDIFYGWLPGTGAGGQAAGLQDIPAETGVVTSHFMGFNARILPDLIPYMAAIHARPLGDPLGGAMHVDGAYSWFRAAHPQYVTIAPVRSISVQRSSRSDIHVLHWFDRIPALAPVVGWLRRARARLRKRL
jgi:hypothetical protein